MKKILFFLSLTFMIYSQDWVTIQNLSQDDLGIRLDHYTLGPNPKFVKSPIYNIRPNNSLTYQFDSTQHNLSITLQKSKPGPQKSFQQIIQELRDSDKTDILKSTVYVTSNKDLIGFKSGGGLIDYSSDGIISFLDVQLNSPITVDVKST